MADDSDTRDPTGDVLIASGDWDAIVCILLLATWTVVSCSRGEVRSRFSLVLISICTYCGVKICNQDRDWRRLIHSEVVEIGLSLVSISADWLWVPS